MPLGMKTQSKMEQSFFQMVYHYVKQIPKGKVATYGQIARACNCPKMSRQVGWALHCNKDGVAVPCYKIVFADGSLASSYVFGGANEQKRLLNADGIEVKDNKVDLSKYRFEFN